MSRIVALLCLAGVVQAEPKGTLVLVGGGATPKEARAEFLKRAGGIGEARIVVIPTASTAADDRKEDDGFLEPWRGSKPKSLELLHTRDRERANDPAFVKPLREATAAWMSGGDQNRLVAAYRGTLVEKELHVLMERGGVVGGTSAGAAVVSELMIEGGKDEARTGPGFGLLKGIVVDQHFLARKRGDRLRGVLAKNPAQAGLGIDEGTAAILHGDELTVVGASTVTAVWPGGAKERSLKTGEKLDLATLLTR